MRPRAQLRLLTVASYVTLALTAPPLALCLMSVAQAVGVQPWDASVWWAGMLPHGDGAFFLATIAGLVQATFQYFRTRAAWRVAALAGDAEAMPRALVSLIPGAEEQVDDTPFAPPPTSLRWGLTDHGRMLRLATWGIIAAMMTGVAALFLWMQVAFGSQMLYPGDPLTVLFPASAGVLALFGVLMVALALRAGLRAPAGVSADSAGISAWSRRGPGALIPWREARLLEVSWFGLARKKLTPFLRVYRADGSSIGWPAYVAPDSGQTYSYQPLGVSDEQAVAAARALVRLAERSGLPIRTTYRSLTDASFTLEQEFTAQAKALDGRLYVVLVVVALGVAILAYRWEMAPWLSVAAAVGLALCAARLAYWYARDVLTVPRTWEEIDKDERPRFPALWPSLMALSSAAALAVSIASVAAGHGPRDTWTNVEVIGGAAVFALSGALMAWARRQARAAAAEPVPSGL